MAISTPNDAMTLPCKIRGILWSGFWIATSEVSSLSWRKALKREDPFQKPIVSRRVKRGDGRAPH
jgi:hypothetical protein